MDGVLLYLTFQRTYFENITLYGLIGFIVGICTWLVPQLGYVGIHSFCEYGLSFSHGHFTDWGGSVITFWRIR